MSFKRSNSPTGTREWSDVSHNIGKGCSHNCRYCYAAEYALRTGQIKTREAWATEILTTRPIPTKPGVIMFPTAHDITPYYLETSMSAIQQMMDAGRSIVIVTKAHLNIIQAITERFNSYKEQLLIRFSIGSMNQQVCSFWEPGAPWPGERLAALKHATGQGYRTSVSMEPILLGYDDAMATYRRVRHCVTEDIWIGKMNQPELRVDTSIDINRHAVAYIRACQSDKEILRLHESLRECPLVRWKDSIRQIVEKHMEQG